MVSKGQFMGLDWNRITRLHSQVMTGTHELTNSITLTRSRRVVGSNPIWGSDFFRVLQTFNLIIVVMKLNPDDVVTPNFHILRTVHAHFV